MKTSGKPSVSSLAVQRHLNKKADKAEASLKKLSSGKRISQASDDAAGLSIASKMTSQIKSLSQSLKNSNHALSFIQSSEGGLKEIQSILSRMRELNLAGAGDGLGISERAYLSKEYNALFDEVDRISKSTQFLKTRLFDNSLEVLTIQVGASDSESDRIEIDFRDMVQSTDALGIGLVSLDTEHKSRLSLVRLDYAINAVSESRAKLGSLQSRLAIASSSITSRIQNAKEARSRIEDADIALETSKLTRARILGNAAAAFLEQTNSGKDVLRLLTGEDDG